MKKLIVASVLITTITLIGCNSCNKSTREDTFLKIKREKKIRVGFISYFDITFRDGNTGTTKGFLVDVLQEILKDIDIPMDKVEFIETDWENFSSGLKYNKFDLSIAGTFRTPDRAKNVNFSKPLFYLGNGAVVKRDDNRFHTIGDFNKEGVRISVVQGEQGFEYAKKNLTKATIVSQSGSDLTLAPLEVKLGKADAALSDQYILKRYCDKNPEVKDALANNPYDVLPICWSVSKSSSDSTLLSYLNEEIGRLERSGKLQEIINKYPMIPFAKIPN